MKWIRYRIRTVPAAEDLIVSEMSQIGLIGAEIEDKVPLTAAEKEQIYTYDAEDPVDDGIAFVSFYSDRDDLKEKIARILSELSAFTDTGDATIDVSIRDDAEWKDRWKQYFQSFMIDDVLVKPSWEEASESVEHARHTLYIDPGCAFGTGAHETTQLAIRSVRRAVDRCLQRGHTPVVLDVGTGSGVLAILALMFGARFVSAVDVDPFTREAVETNLSANGMDKESLSYFLGDLITDGGLRTRIKEEAARRADADGYDIIVCNILPVVLKPLVPALSAFLSEGGVLILSGILAEKKEEMEEVLSEAGWRTTECTAQGEWISLCAEKR